MLHKKFSVHVPNDQCQKPSLYFPSVLFQMNKRFSKYSSTLVNVLLYVNFIYLIQVPHSPNAHHKKRKKKLHSKTHVTRTHTISSQFTFPFSFLARKTRINISPKLSEGCCVFFKPHVLFLSNNFFLGRSQFSSYTLRVYIYFYHHFDSSSSSVVLFFFLPANSLLRKKWFICYHPWAAEDSTTQKF
jgi:hypothetical protein